MSHNNDKFLAQAEYYSHIQMPVVDICRPGIEHVLEVGCAGGRTLAYIKNKFGAKRAVGVELRDDVARVARENPDIDEVIVGDISKGDLPIAESSFDLIVMSFVLEHVLDPWSVLDTACRYLKPGGQLVGALPNVRHVSVLLPLLLKGEWEYKDDGIMDWTHAKFFTKKTIEKLLDKEYLSDPLVLPWVNGKKEHFVDGLTLGCFRDMLCFAYTFSAIKRVC